MAANPAPGRPVFHLAPLREAAHIFPLNVYVREQSAYALLRFSAYLPPRAVANEIGAALVNDPWAPDLRHDRAYLLSLVRR